MRLAFTTVFAITFMTYAAAAEAPKMPAVEQAVLKAPTSASAWLAVAKYHDQRDEKSPAILAASR